VTGLVIISSQKKGKKKGTVSLGLQVFDFLVPSKKNRLRFLRFFHQSTSRSLRLCRMTLLLGPPGSGKTSLLLALAGRLDKDLKVVQKYPYTSAQNWAFKKRGIFHWQLLYALY
jgi:DNA replication protein DnaC